MDPRIMTHPNFTHWRSRSLQLKRKLFRPFRILVCDANVTPNYTLDTVESIVQYPTSRMRALVLTIKFPKWESAENLGEYIDRVKSWGYTDIQVRQLAHNRREVCLIAKDRVKRPEPTVDESSAQDTPLAHATEKSQNAEKSANAAHQANDGE
jgi:23S rRNA (cytidine2498-2'-O)-methyltransferase